MADSESTRVAVLIPCFKRPEYTQKCLQSIIDAQEYRNTTFFLIDDGSQDETWEIVQSCPLSNTIKVKHDEPQGLRNVIIDFINKTRTFDFISKVDNDCKVPKDWLTNILTVIKRGEVDIVSPNVYPSNAAFTYGFDDEKGKGFRPSRIVGGLWTMRRDLLDDVYFECLRSRGIVGAFNIIRQIVVEKNPRVGWLETVTVEDMGHWSGDHPEHIKTLAHAMYSSEVGRKIAWNV